MAGRWADIDAALGHEPNSALARQAKADLQDEEREYAGAIAALTLMLTAMPKDLAAAHAVVGSDAASLANICWLEAATGTALQSALADCDAELAKSPENADVLDRPTLVLMRLGRQADAIADYDHAIRVRPWMATSLYGRAVLEFRKGDVASAQADIRAAVSYDPDIAAAFQRFGVSPAPIAVSKTASNIQADLMAASIPVADSTRGPLPLTHEC